MRVLRFANVEVIENLEGVLEKIASEVRRLKETAAEGG